RPTRSSTRRSRPSRTIAARTTRRTPRGSFASTRCACASRRTAGSAGAEPRAGGPVRIRVYSDLHLEREPFAPPDHDADLIVLAGDIANGARGIEWAHATFTRPVLYLAGNHEYYDGEFESVQSAMRAAAGGAVELLDCTRTVVGDVRFLGCTLWTDYSLAPRGERTAVIDAARKLNPDYQKIRFGARAMVPEDAIALCTLHRSWLSAELA